MRGARPTLEIVAVQGMATVQDKGRPGRMHEGIPPGGALVPGLAAHANRSVGNLDGAPIVEVFGSVTIAANDGTLRVACEDGIACLLESGERLELVPASGLRVRYLAVAGGIDVPEVLGGRGTLLVASLGGYEGRALRRGDRLQPRELVATEGPIREPAAAVSDALVRRSRSPDLERAIRVSPGPDADRFEGGALTDLTRRSFTIANESDRTGTRLLGPPIERRHDDSGRSQPMVRGAIQVPRSGAPIVLGPDHPTTGGYPVVAVVVHDDLDAFFARPIGSEVHFALAEDN
jgi:5-oxoprolinase (ATP-hydrolysing) subunit C